MVEKKKKKKEKPEPEVFTTARPSLPDPLIAYLERKKLEEEEEKKKVRERTATRIGENEMKVEKLRMQIRKQSKSMSIPKTPKYKPLEPVKKSNKLAEFEDSIQKGTFFAEGNAVLENVRQASRRYKLMEKLSAYGAGDSSAPLFGRV